MLYTLENGWILQAKHSPSPNFGPRPANVEPELLVIHNISLPPGEFGGRCIEQFFTNCLDWQEHEYFAQLEGIEVSSHLLIRRTGELVQFVALQDRAWHAGKSCYQGREECNDFSIGIELEGTDCQPYADEQYSTLAAVTTLLLREIPQMNAKAIVGHSDIAPGRKTDPGPAFDWQRYGSSI
ncbi:MAG: AmpD protein [Halioglobus sp.]|jgi:AmpD protein